MSIISLLSFVSPSLMMRSYSEYESVQTLVGIVRRSGRSVIIFSVVLIVKAISKLVTMPYNSGAIKLRVTCLDFVDEKSTMLPMMANPLCRYSSRPPKRSPKTRMTPGETFQKARALQQPAASFGRRQPSSISAAMAIGTCC